MKRKKQRQAESLNTAVKAKVMELIRAAEHDGRISGSTELSKILGVTPQAAAQRLKGNTPFSLDDIEKIAGHFLLPVSALLGNNVQFDTAADMLVAVLGLLEFPMYCRLELDEARETASLVFGGEGSLGGQSIYDALHRLEYVKGIPAYSLSPLDPLSRTLDDFKEYELRRLRTHKLSRYEDLQDEEPGGMF